MIDLAELVRLFADESRHRVELRLPGGASAGAELVGPLLLQPRRVSVLGFR